MISIQSYHLNSSTILSELPSDIRNDIISLVSQYSVLTIKHELMILFCCNYFWKTTNVSTKILLFTVIRFIKKDGNSKERFLLRKICDRTVNALSQHVVNVHLRRICLWKENSSTDVRRCHCMANTAWQGNTVVFNLGYTNNVHKLILSIAIPIS